MPPLLHGPGECIATPTFRSSLRTWAKRPSLCWPRTSGCPVDSRDLPNACQIRFTENRSESDIPGPSLPSRPRDTPLEPVPTSENTSPYTPISTPLQGVGGGTPTAICLVVDPLWSETCARSCVPHGSTS